MKSGTKSGTDHKLNFSQMLASEFKSTVLPCYRRMYAVAMAMVRDSAEAADIVQDAMAAMWNARDRIDPAKAEAYALTATRHTAISHLRSSGGRADTDRLPDVAATGGSEVESRDELILVRRLIDRLPEQQREVLMLSAFDGLSNEEIQDATGCSAANVRQLLSRARRTLRTLYSNYHHD